MLRRFSGFLLVVAAGLTCWAGALWFLAPPQEQEEGILVENVNRDLGLYSIGEKEVVFRVTNRSKKAHQIIGLAKG
jgi:hypothetical protein